MIKGLEEKRVSYIMKDKNKAGKVSEYSALHEVYAERLRKVLEEMKINSNLLANLEIELSNSGEKKALEEIKAVRQKIIKAQVNLMNTINALI
jgi:hypothetical protein